MLYDRQEEILSASQLNVNDMINVFYHGNCIKENCIVLSLIQDNYFQRGLVVYLNGVIKETIDLENIDGIWIKKL